MPSRTNTKARKIRVLPENVARKIAAGEVVDRPCSIVRELMDNAIDSGAQNISVTVNGGGMEEIIVRDDGCGMTHDDLDVCWLAHATSKISEAEDLEEITTLGFRGEALASLASCSRLNIVTSRNGEAFKLSIQGGKKQNILSTQGAQGTTVSIKELFFNIPARRRYLRSIRAESIMCRRIFMEKTAAHPWIGFRLFVDGDMKIYLPPSNPLERVKACWPRLAPGVAAWWETKAEGDGFSFTVVHVRPEIYRRDRRYIHIYANRRRIEEYMFVQGIISAYDAWMPGGAFPVAFVFMEINPALVDFNIHPAKKEARFRDANAVRHRISEAIRGRILGESYKKPLPKDQISETPETPGGTLNLKPYKTRSFQWNHVASDSTNLPPRLLRREIQTTETNFLSLNTFENLRYIGEAFGLFLIVESGQTLYLVDKHAAHERILYDKFRREDIIFETLLIPVKLDVDEKTSMRLEFRRDRLLSMGLKVEKEDDGVWFLKTLPQFAEKMESEIINFLESGAGDLESMEKSFWADLACKAAIKDNDILDESTAHELLEKTFSLEMPRCPHGRPIWVKITRLGLFDLLGRNVHPSQNKEGVH